LTRRLLRNCLLLDPEALEPAPGGLLIEAGRIVAKLPAGEPGPEDAERVDLGGRAVAPGFIDLHFHGETIFHQPAGAAEAVRRDAASCVRHGATAFLATTVAEPAPALAARVEALAHAIAEPSPGHSVPLGIHLEGPWIRAEAAGAQPVPGIRPFSRREAEDLAARAAGLLALVTLAPEAEGARDLLAWLASRGIRAALGHSLASADQVDAAVTQGARHVTHLFNAMGPIHHRAPGLAGAALADDRLTCDAICDGVHVDPRLLRVAARAKKDGLILITDRIQPPAARAGGFGSGELWDDGGVWRLPDGRLAGSRVTLDASIATAERLRVMTRLEAVAACTLRPARLLGIEAERGTLRPGARADLAVLDVENRAVETWLGGERVFAAT
jgi:N-acetylglucosamine-6-phosphate deacetylase